MTTAKHKTKYGILHIPTNLVLHVAYDEDDISPSSIEEEKLLFPSKEDAELFLSLSTTTGLEKKKVTFTPEEKAYIEEYMMHANSTGLYSADKLINNIQQCETLYLTIKNEEKDVTWGVRESLTLLNKFKHHVCVEIDPGCFLGAIKLSYGLEETFKKKTGYALSRSRLYLKEEFSVIEIKAEVTVKTPTNKEFKNIVLDLLDDQQIPESVRNKIKTYIRD